MDEKENMTKEATSSLDKITKILYDEITSYKLSYEQNLCVLLLIKDRIDKERRKDEFVSKLRYLPSKTMEAKYGRRHSNG